MQKAIATIPSFVAERTTDFSHRRSILLIVGASALIALSAQIAVPVPMSPVPMSLQPLAILLVGATLGSRQGAASVVLYLLEGAAGLPVFALGKAGLIWMIAGPTAGYLLAFPAAAFLVGWLSERGLMRTVPGTMLAMIAGIATIHLAGWTWLAVGVGLGPSIAFFSGTMPFLFGDAIKIAIAVAVVPAAHRFIDRTDPQ